ncbi:HAD phosphatase [Moesziomyces antarcticus]|uniref:Uncharacterized protein n=1 Tax=Pseudozyma antarctica TaxID=84753 RepID=A0A5C3FID5_PSEA2|nr:HAD phosphatase [Moesziomyces antarcticus]GAK63548.1 HAD phosphatase [Moesziomyces antarcticus]SPO44138.1 uncharacterized protein PSANT_01823 [Moesziomyces antarcticus]
MGNLSGVVAVLAVLVRPSLVVPHVQVPDIGHLDWSALHANGVRFVVFDKDNCLTAPHSDTIQPSIAAAWDDCQRVFGRENVLVVSNSSGSSDDPSGLGAESLSRALNVPVLCHKQKKPARACAAEALEYFVALSHDRETTLAQAQHMPPGSATIQAGPSSTTRRYLKERRKLISSGVPQDAEGSGSVLVVGDRTMTDVILAHRMNEELSRRRSRIANDAGSHKERAMGAQCVSVLTTGIWAYEGRLNALMRKLEARTTAYLISKGYRPGEPGMFSRRAPTSASMDWQAIAVSSSPTLGMVALSSGDEAKFAYTRDTVPTAVPSEPALGAVLVSALVRPLPRGLGSIISRLLVSRPVVWLSSNVRDGWNVMMQGLAFGVSEAGISRGRKPLALDADVAPPSKTQLKQQAVTASMAEYLDARVGAVSQLGRGGVQHLRQFGSRAGILSRRQMEIKQVRPYSTGSGAGGRPRVPMRNWVAALSALVIVPASYYVGMRLHDLKETKAIDPTQTLPPTPAKPDPQLHHHPAPEMPADPAVQKALRGAQADRKRELELTLFHLVRERQEVLDKLERVHQRRAESH